MSVHYLQNLQKSLQIQNPNVMSMKFDKQKHYTQLHLSNEKKWFSVQSSVDLSNVCVKKKTSRVTFVVDPSGHPLLFFKSIKLDFSILIIQRLLSYPHSMVLRYGVLLGAFEESTLQKNNNYN